MERLIALLKILTFPFKYGKIEIYVEESKVQRYSVTEHSRI